MKIRSKIAVMGIFLPLVPVLVVLVLVTIQKSRLTRGARSHHGNDGEE